LRRAAQRAEQRVVAVGRPAAQNDAQNAHGAHAGSPVNPRDYSLLIS